VNEVMEFLLARGALDVDHPGGNLLTHLRRTHDTLLRWGARPALRLAGLAHAAYGTDGFPQSLIGVTARPNLMLLIGSEAEEIVYTYGSCDRAFSYPTLSNGLPRMRDRFTGTVSQPGLQLVRDFVELTIANELDVLAHNEDLRTQYGDSLHNLFTACSVHASGPANAAVDRFFE
jgi:hypothetical protein